MDETNRENIHTASENNGENIKSPKNGNIVLSKKKLAIIGAVIILFILAYFYKGMFIAATVNGSPISRIAVIKSLEKSSGKQALSTLVTKKVIADEVRRRGITVSEEEVDMGLKYIADQVAAQGGGTLEEALAIQGVSMAEFRANQRTQIEVEKLLGDKIAVTDAEVEQYITEKKINIPEDQLALAKSQIREQMKREKLNTEGQKLVDELKESANISYFVEYGE